MDPMRKHTILCVTCCGSREQLAGCKETPISYRPINVGSDVMFGKARWVTTRLSLDDPHLSDSYS